jgi:hypothetical protein
MAASLVQALPKRNTAMALPQGPRGPSRPSGLKGGLFDGDHEPPDQPRHLIQPLGILLPHGLRKGNEAFLIAHHSDAVRDKGR